MKNSLVSSVLATLALVITFLVFISIFGIVFAYIALQLLVAFAIYPEYTMIGLTALGATILTAIVIKWVIHIFKKLRRNGMSFTAKAL